MLRHNDLKKGDRVRGPGLFGQGQRYGKMMDNMKGMTRLVHIEESNGHYPDMGSVYVNEILEVERDGEWLPVELSPAHAKKMAAVQSFNTSMGW